MHLPSHLDLHLRQENLSAAHLTARTLKGPETTLTVSLKALTLVLRTLPVRLGFHL